MNPAIYRQYDDRWGKLPYPGSGAYLSDSGCGCLAVYHCAIELEEYASKLTVPKCRDYMVQYATVSDGTLWSGITEGLRHYGFKVHWNESDSMDDIFRELKDSCKCGVILFAKKRGPSYGPDGTLWTTIGHYIAFSDYKIENGEHKFYLKDSGPRKHDKWFSYEKSMRGCCRNVWICKSTSKKRYNPSDPSPKPAPTPTPAPWPTKYSGNYPVVKKYLEPGDKGENVIRLQQYLDWYYKGAFFKECGGADGVYGKNTLKWVKKMQSEFFGKKEADGLVGPKTIAEMKKRGGYVEPTPAPKNYTEVIDVSDAQDAIDWKKVKAAGIDGVMVRCGYRGYEAGVLKEDHMFMKHIKGASKAGLKLGIYFFTQALNAKEGKEEANYAISLLNKAGVSLYYPIAVDTEYINAPEGDHPRANNISKTARTNALKGFCDQIKARGYSPMIYACLNDLNNNIDMSKLPFDIWCAQYHTKCQYKGKYVMWQYTSDGRVNGVNGRVDRDQCYISSAAPKPNPVPAKEGVTNSEMPKAIFSDFIGSPKMGQATSDERGKISGGKAGDQTGGEVAICSYSYSNSKSSPYHWVYCFRAKDMTVRLKIADACVKACKNNHIGYDTSSGDRKSLYKEAKKAKWKIDKITTNCETTCSELANVCIAAAGLKNLGTGTQSNVDTLSRFLKNSSDFKQVKVNANSLQAGDILISECHTAIMVQNIVRSGHSSKQVLDLQYYLDWYYKGAFFKECGGADGVYGKNTLKWVKKMQTEFFGAKEADGTVGTKTLAKMKAVKTSQGSSNTPQSPSIVRKNPYSGKYPEVRVKRTAAEVITSTIKWAKWIAANNDFHYGYGDDAHHNGCYFCNTNQAKKGHMNKWEHTYCCNPFVHACFAHGGLVPSMLSMCQKGRSYGFKKGEGYDASKLFKKISRKDAKAGDVFCSDYHVALYIGNGKIIHAAHEDDNTPNSSKWNSSISIGEWNDKYYDPPRVYRFVGKVDADLIIYPGEVSDRIADLQRYLVWYGALPKGEEADGIYGEKTFKAVVKMQTDFFGAKDADGTIGPKTIAKMKAVVK